MRAPVRQLMLLVVVAITLIIAVGLGQATASPREPYVGYLPFIALEPTPTPTLLPVRTVFSTGLVGGNGGDPFSDLGTIPDTSYVTGVNIKSGMLVDNVQMVLNTGPLAAHGGPGGDTSTSIILVSGEYIKSITGNAGCVVDQITIQTNLRTFGQYGWGTGANDTCGNGQGFTISVPPGYEIVGFLGRSGVLMDALGVLYRIHR